MIKLTPTNDFPLPFDLSPDQPKTHKDSIAVAANTADLISELGGTIDYSDSDLQTAAALILGEKKSPKPRHITSAAEAKAAAVLVKRFDFQAFDDAQQARNYITNKLVKLSDCGDPKLELKALELLGKHSDIGLFTERSEVTVNHRSAIDLENSIKERIKRLLNADTIDGAPLVSELMDDFGDSSPAPAQTVSTLLSDLDDEDDEDGKYDDEAIGRLDDDDTTSSESSEGSEE